MFASQGNRAVFNRFNPSLVCINVLIRLYNNNSFVWPMENKQSPMREMRIHKFKKQFDFAADEFLIEFRIIFKFFSFVYMGQLGS